jgi:dolichyl-phosphate-mannose-protein mannosyltransferase
MGRVTYLHHYFPALFFGIMSFAFLFDHLSQKCKGWVRWTLFLALLTAVLSTFVLFSPICYGMEGKAKVYSSIDWVSSWNIVNDK